MFLYFQTEVIATTVTATIKTGNSYRVKIRNTRFDYCGVKVGQLTVDTWPSRDIDGISDPEPR